MGYRSKVGLALTKNGVKKMEQMMLENLYRPDPQTYNYLFNHTDEHYTDEDGSELLIWSGVKWYNDYKEVQTVERIMKDLDSRDYKFVRIGEEVDDIEEHGEFYDNSFDLSVSRELYYST